MENSEGTGDEPTPLEILRRRVAAEKQQKAEEDRLQQEEERLFNQLHEGEKDELIEQIHAILHAAAIDLTEVDKPHGFAQAQEITILQAPTPPGPFTVHRYAQWSIRTTPTRHNVVAWLLPRVDLKGVLGAPFITIDGGLVALPPDAPATAYLPVDLAANTYTVLLILKGSIVERVEEVRYFNEPHHHAE